MERQHSICEKIENYLKEYQNWTLWRTIILGQFLSILLCTSQYISHHITTSLHLAIPTSQNYLRYMMICSIFTTILACRKGEKGIFSVIRTRGYRYVLIGLIDLEACTLLATSHQFSSLINIQFLDCVALPVSIVLSCLTLGVRFRFVHMLGVSICLLGVGSLVWAGIGGTSDNDEQSQLVGDMLCFGGAILFAVASVLQEFICKTYDCIEYLGMIGLCGSCLCGIQMFLIEKTTLMHIDWAKGEILFYLGAFAVVQFIFYSLLPHVLKYSGSTAVQLYLLTADFYTLVTGIVSYHYRFHAFYLLSFFLTMTGVYVYSIKRLPILNLTRSTELLAMESVSTQDNRLLSLSLRQSDCDATGSAEPLNNTTEFGGKEAITPREYTSHYSNESFEMNVSTGTQGLLSTIASNDMNINVTSTNNTLSSFHKC